MLNEGNQKLFSNVNILISGYFISTILSAISTIFIINFLSVDSYALMNIALIMPTIFILIGDFGLNSATTHFIASKKITNPKEVRNIAKINIYIKIFIGFLYSLVLIINAGGIAKYIYNINNSNMILLIWFGSIGVFSTLLFDSVNYAFIGLENMSAMRYSTISRKIIEAAVSIGLLLIGFGAIGPLIGLFLGPLIASLFGLIYLKRKLNTFYSSGMGLDWSFLLKMIKYGYPLSFVTLIVGIQPQIFTFLLIQLGNIKFVSFFNVAYASKKIIFILTQSISFTFFPAFSRFNWEKIDDRNKLKSKYQFSIKIGSFLILPITLLLIIFSREIFPIIFGSKYIEASLYISLFLMNYLLVPFGSLSISAFFLGQKQTKTVLLIEIVKLLGAVLFSIFLINYLGGISVMLGILFGSILGIIIANLIILKKYGKGLFQNIKNTIGIFLIAIILGFFIFILKSLIFNFYKIFLIKIIVLFSLSIFYLTIFLILVGLFSLINQNEIEAVNNLFKNIPILNKIVKKICIIEYKLLRLNKNLKGK